MPRHRPPHPARGLPPPARARPGELPARVGRAGPARALLARRLRLAPAHLRGGRALRRAGRRLPLLRLRREARADRADAGRRARPAREPLRRRRRARPLRPRARRRRGAARRPGETSRAARERRAAAAARVAARARDAALPVAGRVRAGVVACKEYIRQGDAFQIVLSQRAERPTAVSALALYRVAAPRQPVAVPLPARARRHRARRLVARDARQVRGHARDAEPDRRLDAARRGRRRAAALLREGSRRARDARRPRPQRPLARVPAGHACSVERFLEAERFSHITHLVSEVAGELRRRRDAVRPAARDASRRAPSRARRRCARCRSSPSSRATGAGPTPAPCSTRCPAARSTRASRSARSSSTTASRCSRRAPASSPTAIRRAEHEECLRKLAALEAAIDLAEAG